MNKWTDSDILLLKKCFLIKTKQELVDIFPQRTYLAIWKKAHKLGLTAPDDIKWKNRSIANTLPKQEKIKNYKGYNLVYAPDHPRADSHGRVFEHIIVWENYYNEKVTEDYVIHHINGIKDDNRIENLKKMLFGEHTAYHNKNKKRRK